MGSKNLRSSGSSASGLKGGLKAWLHRDKGADMSTKGCAGKKAHLFSKKKGYSVSRDPDFNWSITRYDKSSEYEAVRTEFEKRRSTIVEIPKTDVPVQAVPEKTDVPERNNVRSTVPTLDVYFKEEYMRADTKVAVSSEPKPGMKTYRQEGLFDRQPKMVEAEEDDTFLTGISYFSSVSSSAAAPTCASVSEIPVQSFGFDVSEDEHVEVISEIGSNEQCSTVIENSEEDLFIESLCEDLATFTVMNDILPEEMAEEEIAEEHVPVQVRIEDPEDKFIVDLCEDIVAKFIIDELMPGILEEKKVQTYVPEYVISEISEEQSAETVIGIPAEITEERTECVTSEVTSFLFGFGTPAVQKKGTTGFTFVFGNNDDVDYDDQEVASVSSNDAAITASSLSGGHIGL